MPICRPLSLEMANRHLVILGKLFSILKQCILEHHLLPCPASWDEWDSGASGSCFPSGKGWFCLVPCLRETSHLAGTGWTADSRKILQ